MSDCRTAIMVEGPETDCEEMVTGIMRFSQEERGVKDFPLFSDPRWHCFLGGIQEVYPALMPRSLHLEFELPQGSGGEAFYMVCGHEDISFALTVVASIDTANQRMRLKEESPSGRKFLDHYRYLAEDAFDLAYRIKGFLRF